MKQINNKYLNDKEKIEQNFKTWSFLFQIRIILGFLFSVVYPALTTNQVDIVLVLLYVAIYLPLAVSIILFNKKLIAFRIWYVIGVAILATISVLSGGTPYSLIFEIIIVAALFRWKYVNDNFTAIWFNKKTEGKNEIK